MYSYLAYGLGIHSQWPLPDLVAAASPAHILVRQGSLTYASRHHSEHRFHCRHSPRQLYLYFPEAGRFLIREGHEIIVDGRRGCEDGEMRQYFLGPVMAGLLSQRGLLVLHASAVSVNGSVVAFVGGSGWGKSSIAAALYGRGHPLVADDLIPVQTNRRPATVFPGFPRLRLYPTATAFLNDNKTKPETRACEQKHSVLADRDFSPSPLPLGRIYVLTDRARQKVRRLTPREGLVELLRHTYAVRFWNVQDTATHFKQCAFLAGEVEMYHLSRKNLLQALPELCTRLEEACQ